MVLRRMLPSLLVGFLAAPFPVAGQEESGSGSLWPILRAAPEGDPIPGTQRLVGEGDFADQILTGADAFLLEKIEASRQGRQPTREELARILGMPRDERPAHPRIEYLDTIPGARATKAGIQVSRVRWRAFREVYGYGLLLEPPGAARATVVAIPDADQTPEEIAGGTADSGTRAFALRLAARGCRVLVPSLISRKENPFAMPEREYLHRSAYVLGRTLIGYELHSVLAGAEALRVEGVRDGYAGWGEGGRLALYAGALDGEAEGVLVGGYFAPREEVWKEPADRTVFGLLNHCGDAEIASLIAPERLVLEHGAYPRFAFRADGKGEPEIALKYTGKRGKPGRLIVPSREEFAAEVERIPGREKIAVVLTDEAMAEESLSAFLHRLDLAELADSFPEGAPSDPGAAAARQAIQVQQIDAHNQWALIDSRRERAEFLQDLKTDGDLAAYEKSAEPYRKIFREEVIGHFGERLLPPDPRSRSYQKGEGVRSYEVVLDTLPGLVAYGILTVPEDFPLDGSRKLPVVVCQHGLEGRPQQVIGEAKYSSYKAFATRLAQRGYITFAPQNLYIHFDRFRTLQFKANAVGKTLFSLMVPQHEQITRWLAEQPWVEADRIGFYGLSYGGKSAMRIPALVDRYALSICSADFNEWVWKNAATDPRSLRYSYASRGEYEIFEFNLGGTFNYAEMAALLCPRPFMVERGHFDGVAPDETVAYEYAKVRNLYAARLGIPERTTIEWFPGPHTINGVGTFAFLDRWLKGE